MNTSLPSKTSFAKTANANKSHPFDIFTNAPSKSHSSALFGGTTAANAAAASGQRPVPQAPPPIAAADSLVKVPKKEIYTKMEKLCGEVPSSITETTTTPEPMDRLAADIAQ